MVPVSLSGLGGQQRGSVGWGARGMAGSGLRDAEELSVKLTELGPPTRQ